MHPSATGMGRVNQGQESSSIGSTCTKMLDGMSQGTAYKFCFLVGIFLANASRAAVLLFDLISHAIGNSDYASTTQTKSTTILALSGLPTLFLMSSFSIFIYYFAQVTIQLESQSGRGYGKYL